MLFQPHASSQFWVYDNWGTNPSATIGTSIIPGTSNTEGSWTQIASSANISQDVYGIYMQVHSGATSAIWKGHLIDIGIDLSGGTSYVEIISNILCGSTPSLTVAGNREFFFPYFIPAGSSIAIRAQGSASPMNAGTISVAARFYGRRSRPEFMSIGTISETLGVSTANTSGVSFTPGNAADGTWTLLGTTTKKLWWWQLGYQINNGTITAEYTYLDLAFGDSSNKQLMFRVMHGGTTTETCGLAAQTNLLSFAAYNSVPANTNIYIRGRCNNAPDAGYNAVAIGIG